MGYIQRILILLFFTLITITNGLGQALTCEDADLLCSLSELNGFSDSMPQSNPNDEPAPLCPNSPGIDGNPQNMTWFSFISGNPTATMVITFTNCQGGNNFQLVQYGIYNDCSFDSYLTSVCEGDPQPTQDSNGNTQPITINIAGMIPGDDYFFFIDGDGGTYCDYSIEVTSGGWTNLLTDPISVDCISGNCPPDGILCNLGENLTFEPQNFSLTIDYNWTVTDQDGNIIEMETNNPLNTADFTFNNPGVYEICVVANNGCTMTNPVCYDLTVLAADAGTLSADPETLCPNETSTVTATDFFTIPPIEQAMIAVGPDGIVIEVIAGGIIDVTYPECGVVTVYSYNYQPTDAPGLPIVGSSFTMPNCNINCCDIESIEVTFEDNEDPTFSNIPADITIECDDPIPPITEVTWDDNCTGTGSVAGTQMDDYNTCMGGTITRTWSYTDLCDNNVEESQTITISAQMEGSFSSEPADETYECFGDIPAPIDLTWTGACEGTATVSPVDGPEPDPCTGGAMTRTWSYNDPCGSFTEYIQTFTIDPLPEGSFSSEPANETYDCVAEIPPPMDLTWTGGCSGTSSITPIDGVEPDLCSGGTMTRTWSYNDICVVTEYVQTFTINSASGGDFVNPPGPITVQCDLADLPPTPTLEWMGDCSGTAMVAGTEDVDIESCSGGTVIREWSYTDPCGAIANYFQVITVSPPPAALPVNPPPANITLECDEVPTTFPDLVFDNGQIGDCSIMGIAEPEVMGDPGTCGGPITVIWVYTDACFTPYTYVQNIIISPATTPEFENPPADMTISCLETLPTFPDLNYSNGETGACELSGSIEASVNVDGDICGGDIVGIWQIPDPCNPGEFIEHIQTITIEPITEAIWEDPPASVTVQCSESTPPANNLPYTNSESGTCEIIGSVPAVVTGTSDACGGEITYTWQFTDACDRDLDHQQVITIEPASEPAFVNPPVDITIGCDEIPPTPPSLDYTNGEPGACLISGNQLPVVDDNSNSCGGSITYTWQFTDPCGRPVDHMQTVTITEAPMADFINPPAAITVDCNNIPTPAGPLSYTNSDACAITGSIDPTINDNYDICGGTIENTWSFTDECGRLLEYDQVISVNPAPIAAFIDVPTSTTVACGADATNPGNLNYTNGETGGCSISGDVAPTQTGSYTACGGDIQFTWDFTDECGRPIQAVQTVVVEPAPAAEFINLPPADITVSCADFQSTPPNLSYTNGETDICLISGFVPGIVIGNPNPCGNTVQYRWVFTDDCGRNISYNQNVTIELAPESTFTNPPGPITVDCADVPSTIPGLSYTNGATGVCAIAGSVPGIQSGVYTECGGSVTYSWTFTDECNRAISHDQVITINPASDPVFLSPPADITLDCGEDFPDNPTLDYTNSEGGTCAISGSVTATSSVAGDITTYTWSFTNDCNGMTIEETQNVTGVPTPDISIDPLQTILCLGEFFDLSTIAVTDATGNSITLTYETGGSIITDPNVSPTGTTVYTIIASNAAGCTDEATFTINIDDPPFAGTAAGGQVCSQGGFSYNLFDYLSGSFTPGGTWFDTDASGANIDNPIMATFGEVASGTYTFTYTVFSTNSCPDAEVEVEIEVISELEFEILSVQCDPGGATYSINVISNGNTIFSNPGDVTVIDANNVVINNIPEGQNVIVSAIDANAFCISDQFVSAPDCDCPTITSPISNGDFVICEGDPIPELSVTIEAGLIANWYPDQTSTVALIENSFVYTPTVTDPGTYNYYVEAEDTDGCVSIIRTQITLTINAKPDANSIAFPICADETGNASIDLQTINFLINSNASFTYAYYPTLVDAENETNTLNNAYILSATTSFFVVVTNSTNCKEIAEVILELNPLPTFTLDVNSEICIDSMDGSIIITNIDPVGSTFSLDNTIFESVTSFDELEVENYTLYAQSDMGCISETTFEIKPGLEFGLINLEINCNSNGTDTDSSDDFYSISFNLSNTIGSTNEVNIQSPAIDFGNFAYGVISFDITAGSPEVITITDLETGCSIEFATGDLTPCSTNCSLAIDQLEIFCNGNGTDSDPSDDIYEIMINASSVNGAANNTFNVTVDGVIVANFIYGTGGTINIPAQGQIVVISAVDNADNQCFVSQTIGPLNPCSDECIISIDNQNFNCDNGGTAGVPGDDTYTFSFTILSTNSSSTTFDLYVDNVNVGTFNYEELSAYNMPADGMTHTIEFVDSNDSGCTAEIISPELVTCSGDCSINVVPQLAICQNQNTGTDPTDDTFIADVFINIVGGGNMWTILETSQTGNNGETVTVGPFLISDGNIILTIQDSGISSCTQTITIEAPSTCSACDDTLEAGDNQFIDCDNIEATLSGVPTTNDIGTWTGLGGFSENMNEVIVTEAGMYYFTVDFGQGCILTDSAEVIVTNLVLDSQNIECSNGGTIGMPEDDTYIFTFNLTSTNPASTMYNLWVNGIIVGTYNYGEDSEYILSADDSTPTLEFIDIDNATCVVEVISPQLISCSGECNISTVYQNIECNDENTADNSADDTWTGELTVFQIGGTGTWTIVETGQTGIPGENIIFGPYLIVDGAITFTINDTDIPGCGIVLTISPPPTCSNCNETVEAGANITLDCINTEATLIGVPSIPNVGTWNGPGGFTFVGNEVTTMILGTYYFTADFGNNCIRTDSVVVDASNEVPLVFAGENQSLTCLVDSVTLTGMINGGSGNFTFQWLDKNMVEVSTETSIKVGDPGNYFFVVYDVDSDCISPPSLVEVIDETADLMPEINANPSFVFDCQVDKITLQVVEEPNVEYRWYIGSVLIQGAATSLTIIDPGVFRLEATHTITGCTGMAELVIEDQIQYPIPFIQPAELLDCDNGFINLDGSSSQTGETISYTWLDVDSMVIAFGVNNLDVIQGGTYYLQLVDQANNCINFDTIVVLSNIEFPIVELDEEAIIKCDGSDVTVTLTTLIDPSSFTFDWQTNNGNIVSGNDTPEVIVSTTGLYTVSVVNPENNCETLDSIEIILPPFIEDTVISLEGESCEESNNGAITIENIQGGTAPYSYFLNEVEVTGNIFSNLMQGIYDLRIEDDNGCLFYDVITVDLEDPFEVNLIPEITINQGQTTQLTANVNLPDSEIASIVWTPDTYLSCPTCLITEVTGGTGDLIYTVEITDINGCYAEAMIIVRSNEEIVITVPNIFKPNNQGTSNSNFTIYSSVEATINKVQVFDRWGNMMFFGKNIETNNPSLGWDGKYNNTFVEQGVFVYYAEILIGNEVFVKKGDITVLR
ncbi:MAG: gliding motility-associated-like protein [Saprospiraceae bacterium]|jgi:gliding motility-associated-like protein